MRLQKALEHLLVLIAVVGILATMHISRAANPKPSAATQQELARYLRKHEPLQLNSKAVARQVRETGRLSLATSKYRFDLELVPHDMRATNYRAEEVLPSGVVQNVEMGLVVTYRGAVSGIEGAEARFTIDDDKVEGDHPLPRALLL